MTEPVTGLDAAREVLRGVTVTTVTPFLPDSLDVDYDGMRRNLVFLRESEVAALVPAGNTGEFHSLTAAECEKVTRVTIEIASDRKAVFAGVGGDLRTARKLALAAQQTGAAGILVHEPAHTFVSVAGLREYYDRLCDGLDIGVAIYKRTPRLPDSVLIELANAHTNIVAVKYAWNDVAAYTELVSRMPASVICACGSAERWALPFSAAGTTGFTSGIANFAPEVTTRFWSALQSGPQAESTREQWQRFAAVETLRARDAAALNVPVIKAAMDMAGLAGGPPRPPLSALDASDSATLRDLLVRLGVRLDPQQ